MNSELDEFGLTVKRFVGLALADLEQAHCRWRIAQAASDLGPVVTIEGPSGPVEFQIDYEEQVELNPSELESLVRQHVRNIFLS